MFLHSKTLFVRLIFASLIFFGVLPKVKSSVVSSSEFTEFEADFLHLQGSNKVDLSRFSYGANVLPGTHTVSIYVNGDEISSEAIEFKVNEQEKVLPCLKADLVKSINLNYERLTAEMRTNLDNSSECIDLQSIIPDSKVDFDSSMQRLVIEIPQAFVNGLARGAVSSELWDEGVPAFLFGYHVNGYRSKYGNGQANSSVYASINSGLNIGGWYFRHNGSYIQQNGGHEYQAINTYVQHDVDSIRGRAVFGEFSTTGQLFNSVPFTGVQLYSDENMLPSSRRGYAPEIRGVAKTNAKVTIKQQDVVIYETTVTPGAFLINDLYPTGYGGDLDVTIMEADGTSQRYSMPYSSVAQLLRPGAYKYSLTAGSIRDSGIAGRYPIYEATWQHGLSNMFTGAIGLQLSEHYYAGQLGLAVGTKWGAFGVDVTHSESEFKDNTKERVSGQSYRVNYSKLIPDTNSNITLAAYRFSSSGYMDLMSATRAHDSEDYDYTNTPRSKNRYSLSISQGLPEQWGSLYANASSENYWNAKEGYTTQYQLGYSNTFKKLSYGVNVSRTFSAHGENSTGVYLNLSYPLGFEGSKHAPTLSINHHQNSQGDSGEQLMLSGILGEENQYSYNLSASRGEHSETTVNAQGRWNNAVAMIDGSFSASKSYQSASLGMSGAMVVHEGGATMTPYHSDSYALIEAKGAAGARVSGYAGAKVDSSGYALFPSPTPYQMNHVGIDPEGASFDVEFDSTAKKVVPRAGAVVKTTFKTNHGMPVLITAKYAGEPVPFGADVFDEDNNNVGMVTQNGGIYARLSHQSGVLMIKWGDDVNSRCQVNYNLQPTGKNSDLQYFEAVCVAA
ncbi:fimbria/pilus outer membrane usher protein [Aeromonas sanarellii]|uniref:fimbria/pilus outer membrane usher protein n=2 Tax=Aeromonas TaxID=642 RepID=UPI00399F1452